MKHTLLLIGRGLRSAADWLSGRSLAHLFFVTRHQEQEIERLRVDCERWRQDALRAQQLVAEQAARFAEERKSMLDRFVPVIEAREAEPNKPPDGWETLERELFAANPLDRKIKQAQWEDELRFRRQQETWGETLDETQAAEAEDEEKLRADFAERARQARLNELGAV